MIDKIRKKINDIKETYKEYGLSTAIHFHWWNVSRSGSAKIFGIDIYGDFSDKLWHKILIRPTYNFFIHINDRVYWIKYRYIRKYMYNTVFTELKPGYYDQDKVMLYACFKVLSDYIDEMGGEEKIEKFNSELLDNTTNGQQAYGYNPPDHSVFQANNQHEALTLYRWWKYEYPEDLKQLDKLLHEGYSGKLKIKEGTKNEIDLSPESNEQKIARKTYSELEVKIEDDEQIMLQSLIKIRRSLWV